MISLCLSSSFGSFNFRLRRYPILAAHLLCGTDVHTALVAFALPCVGLFITRLFPLPASLVSYPVHALHASALAGYVCRLDSLTLGKGM